MQTEYELIHHGILGMKWGVRRYQPYGEGGYNPKHKGVNKISNKQQRYKARKAKTKADRARDSKDRDLLSDKALNDKIKRLQKEKQLKDLTEETLHPGRAIVKKAAKGTIGAIATGAATYAGYLLLQKAMGTKVHLPKNKLFINEKGASFKYKSIIDRLKDTKITIGKAERLALPEEARWIIKPKK